MRIDQKWESANLVIMSLNQVYRRRTRTADRNWLCVFRFLVLFDFTRRFKLSLTHEAQVLPVNATIGMFHHVLAEVLRSRERLVTESTNVRSEAVVQENVPTMVLDASEERVANGALELDTTVGVCDQLRRSGVGDTIQI